MRKFLRDILLFTLLVFFAMGGNAYFNYVPRNSFLSLSGSKHARLDSLPKPRIILAGGSNLLMGMDTSRLETNFRGYHAVNMSLTILLKQQFPLRDIERNLRAGDVVVLCVEYENLMDGAQFGQLNGVYLLEAIEQHPSSILAFDYPQWRAVISGSALEYTGIVTRRSPFHWRNFLHPVRKERDIYLQSKFNDYGDAIFTLQESPKPNRSFGLLPGVLVPARLHQTVQLLNDFSEKCRAAGARCFLSYPPYPKSEYLRNESVLNQLDGKLKAEVKMPFLGSPGEMLFSDSLFWDTQYHLLQQGPFLRTDRLIDQLRTVMNESQDKTRENK